MAPPPAEQDGRRCRRSLAALLALVGIGVASGPVLAADKPLPNILFIVTDDIGIDQWQLFGYGEGVLARTPNINAIAAAGIKFNNVWAMPACSNGRAAFITGRYPFRTNVLTAIGNNDLANFMVNPNEAAVPKLLKQRGYQSALFGKYHLGIQGNNPYGYHMVQSLGFDYFDGWLDDTGDPSSIDTTAGGVSKPGTWSCGFVRDARHGGADKGACYAGNNTCREVTKSGAEAPGRICRDAGGIFDPDRSCVNPTPGYIDFSTLSGHYVSPLVINHEDGSVERVPSTDLRARTYRGTEQIDAAIAWINRQPKGRPWMATVTFASAHTPLMQPPRQSLPAGEPDTSNLDCVNLADQRILSDQMEEALDTEVGRLLLETGLAGGANGHLVYRPKQTNSYVILVTDNGSSGGVVKAPFDPTRAKSTVYQTGVWVPGIVAGPGVNQPGREVGAMVNLVDFYQLFGELAGIDVHKSVPRIVDAQSMLPYLKNPKQPSIRTTNFTQIGTNLHANGEINGPCVYNTTTCTQIAPTKGVCEDNNGVWWGAGATDPSTKGIPPQGLQLCCQVAVWQRDHHQTIATDIYPLEAEAIRNNKYKLVINQYQGYDSAANSCMAKTSTEFYEINEKKPPALKLDKAGTDLLASGIPLGPEQKKNYVALTAQLKALRASQPDCPEDINLDGVVNRRDVAQWGFFQKLSGGYSSWADINLDGLTDLQDLEIVLQNQGNCRKRPAPAIPPLAQ